MIVSTTSPIMTPRTVYLRYALACLFLCLLPFSANAQALPLPDHKPSRHGAIPKPPQKYTPSADGGLTPDDQELYRAIFDAQDKGRMTSADQAMKNLSDLRLRGHVLYQRYMHPTAYISKFDELKNWLDYYGDHPGAEKIYKLAQRKGGAEKARLLKKPASKRKIPTIAEPTMVARQPYHLHVSGKTGNFEKQVNRLIRKKRAKQAVDKVFEADQTSSRPAEELDYLKAKIASSYLYSGNMAIAYELAQQAHNRSGDKVPLAGWICGLISWSSTHYDFATRYFETAARSEYSSGWMQAAASYWAARAHARTGNVKQVKVWLAKAQKHPRTFYGLLATRSAGDEFSFNWAKPELNPEMRSALSKIPAASRAMALLDIGQKDLAEDELVYINARDTETRKALLALSTHYDLPALSIRLGSLLRKSDSQFYDAALYPEVSHKSHGLYKVDPALIHAITRQESRFDTRAESRSGALGLMQIMPATAKYVAKRNDVAYKNKKALLEPTKNLNLGQHYINNLLSHPAVENDLVSMLIAYNAGPGNLRRWKNQWNTIDDTLLFIELMPSAQTRDYVEKVLSNYWIYRLKQGRDMPTIEMLARGKQITYAMAAHDLPYQLAENR